MENMKSEKKCQHLPVYKFDNKLGVTVRDWICSRCGHEGRDGYSDSSPESMYYDLVDKKKRGGFKQ